MLSGIGPKEHLERKGHPVPRRPPRRRPEPAGPLRGRRRLHHEARLRDARRRDVQAAAGRREGDPCFREWLNGEGIYTIQRRHRRGDHEIGQERPDPDLFLFGLLGNFTGYYPGYSDDIERSKNYLTWAIVKAHTNNTQRNRPAQIERPA